MKPGPELLLILALLGLVLSWKSQHDHPLVVPVGSPASSEARP